MINTYGESVVGINLDALKVSLSISDASTREITSQIYDQLPPAALMPELENEPIRIDLSWPPTCRGLGQIWPPSSTINQYKEIGRIPLAYAWNAMMQNREWSWHVHGRQIFIKPELALATTISDLVTNASPEQKMKLVICTIPNLLNEFSQQRLIDACGLLGIKIKLLWRPVAAAIGWCGKFSDVLTNVALKNGCIFKQLEDVLHAQTASLGKIACAHFGLDRIELTFLDVAALGDSNGFQFLPIRKRPLKDSVTPSFGMNLLSYVANKFVEINDGTITPERVWNLIWGTPFAANLFSMVGGNHHRNSVPYEMLGYQSEFSNLLGIFNDYGSNKSNDSVLSKFNCFEDPAFDVQTWANWLNQQCNQSKDVLGIVVTGPLADVKNHSFSKWILKIAPDKPVLFCTGEESKLLSQMAADYGAMLLQGKPTYLDTLPRLRIATLKMGEPSWIPLLTEDDQYVEGGKIWKRPENIEGFEILSGSKDLTVAFHHENFETIRKIKSNFPLPISDRTQVSLSVSMESAHGNASIEVLPHKSGIFGQQRLFLEWRYMEDTKKTPKRYLDEDILRICPEHRPRSSNRSCWTRVRENINTFLRDFEPRKPSIRSRPLLEQCKDSLMSSPIGYAVNRDDRAISSEGAPPSGNKDLDDFVDSVVSILQDDKSKIPKDICVRSLGYTMTANQEFAIYLRKQLKSKDIEIDTVELAACGLCLRENSDIQLFTEVLYKRCNKLTGIGNWIKAFAYILRFRQQATAELNTEKCSTVAECLLVICQQQYNERKLNYLFRHASQSIIYLLRRRIYDDNYLDPDSSLAREIKALFKRAIRAIKNRQIEHIGGAVNLPQELQKFIDYIDRRGTGMLTIIDSDD